MREPVLHLLLAFTALAAPGLAQQPRPSPSPAGKKETPSYTSDDLDRIAGRTPGEAPKAPPTPEASRVIESEVPSVPDLPVVRAREGNLSEGPEQPAGGWAERAQALREQVTQAQDHAKELDQQAQTLLWQYLQSTDTYEILRLKAEQQEILDQIPDAKKAAEDAAKALADFMREAAQAGVPPSEIQEKKQP